MWICVAGAGGWSADRLVNLTLCRGISVERVMNAKTSEIAWRVTADSLVLAEFGSRTGAEALREEIFGLIRDGARTLDLRGRLGCAAETLIHRGPVSDGSATIHGQIPDESARRRIRGEMPQE